MSIRNCGELGENLQKIIKRLLNNDNLVKLLYYTDVDPFSQNALTPEEKQKNIYEKLIKIIPHVGTKDTANSVIVVYIQNGSKIPNNKEFRNIKILIDVFVPMTQFLIKDTNLRPFAILGQIEESLVDKTINGLGKISGGDFALSFITKDVCCYQQSFEIIEYD